MEISFNCRLKYNQCQDCIKKIQELGGDGNVTVGGSWYTGTKEQISELIAHMAEKGYDLDSMSFSGDPKEATQKQIDELKLKGTIE